MSDTEQTTPVVDTKTTENVLQVKVVTRATYDNRETEGTNDDYTMYFIKEPSDNYAEYVSLALGSSKQSDIININSMLGLKADNAAEIQEYQFDYNTLNSEQFKIPEKVYIYEDPNLGVAKAFVYSPVCEGGTFIPLYGAPIWEEL